MKTVESDISQFFEQIHLDQNGTRFKYQGVEYFLPLPGEHQLENLALCIKAWQRIMAGLNVAATRLVSALENLKNLESVSGRIAPHPHSSLTVFDDSYNANEGSFLAAIDFLTAQNFDEGSNSKRGSRSWVVMGEIAEVGEFSEDVHARIAAHAAQKGVSGLLVCTDQKLHTVIRTAWDKAGGGWIYLTGKSDANLKAAINDMIPELSKNDKILIKGSRSSAMERILPLLDGIVL